MKPSTYKRPREISMCIVCTVIPVGTILSSRSLQSSPFTFRVVY